MVARIFKKSKTAMQSGTGNADQWFLEFDKNDHKPIVMSWIGSSDTTSQIRLKFENKDDATQYAHRNNILFFIDGGSEKMNVRKNGYGDNFDYKEKAMDSLAIFLFRTTQLITDTNLINFKFTMKLSYGTTSPSGPSRWIEQLTSNQ